MSDNSGEKKTGELDLQFFGSVGFTKRKCIKCGSFYWSSDPGRKTCGDPPCDSYSFIGNSPVLKPYSLKEMREAFLSFFKGTHHLVNPYPVVPRWRDDVLLVNASIYDFQPHVTSGRVKPPGNPLTMSQPSIRMTDTDLVGETGRHLTCFEMLCHDAFNYPDSYVYWKEETVKYCYDFLNSRLGVDGMLITFKEKPWSGGGNGGNAFEVFVRGLEVATLVFMDLHEDESGEFEIDGKHYSRMEMKIVDTGYGLERLTWLSQGTPTVYQAVMPEVVQEIVNRSRDGKMDNTVLSILSAAAVQEEPFNRSRMIEKSMEVLKSSKKTVTREELDRIFEYTKSVFTLADHSKTLMVLFSDFVIPSNVKVGYLARLLIRRSMRAIKDLQATLNLVNLIDMHWKSLAEIFPGYSSTFASEALRIEEAKFTENERKSQPTVLRMFDRRGIFTADDLVTLYDSYGIVPEEAASIVAKERGVSVEIPEDFNSLVVKRHETSKAEKSSVGSFPDIYTRPLYYDDPTMQEFNAVVLYSRGNDIITNQTAFYPEGGGQPFDLGYFTYKGHNVDVTAVHRHRQAVVHALSSAIPEKSRIIGHIDYVRRRRLMVHHSATHLLLGVLREVLGNHVWQSGVQKGTERSRLDITHFKRLTPEEIKEVERRCLLHITENRPITVRNVEWNTALSRYGFRLFEGGVPEGREIRVVEIQGVDAEGCGGTHLRSTGEIGFLKILRVETLQEGIQRIIFAAGDAALEFVQEMYESQLYLETMLSVKPEDLSTSVQRLFQENLSLKKERDRHIKEEVDRIISEGSYVSSAEDTVLLLRQISDPDVLKALVTAIFARKIKTAVLPYGTADALEMRIISDGNDHARLLAVAIAQHLSGKIAGSGRHITITGISGIPDEKLISRILDGKHS